MRLDVLTSSHSQKDAPVRPRQYAAFLSYSHEDNRQHGREWASWLHHQLETYEIPPDLVGTQNAFGEPVPARIYPVFRDEEELPSSADLSASIVHALEVSASLLVLCSPGAAASRFVATEIARFKMMGKDDRVIAAIISGVPNAVHEPARECFPDTLRFEVTLDGQLGTRPAEPLAADFRAEGEEDGWTAPEAYRKTLEERGVPQSEIIRRVNAFARRLEAMKLKVIAGILGVPLGVLTQRDRAYQIEQEKRRARALRRWLAAVGGLAALTACGGLLAWTKQREVVRTLAASDFQQGTVLLENDETLAQGLALLARAVREGGHSAAAIRLWTLLQQRALWVPVQANVHAPTTAPRPLSAEMRGRFSAVAYNGASYVPKFMEASPNNNEVVTIIGDRIDVFDEPRHVRVWTASGSPLTPWFIPSYHGEHYVRAVRAAHFSPDGALLAIVASGWREPEYVEVRNIHSNLPVGGLIEATGRAPQYQGVGFSDVRWIGISRQWVSRDPAPHPLFSAPAVPSEHVALLLLASRKGDATVYGVSPRTGEHWQIAVARHQSAVTAAAVDSAQEWLMSASADGEVHVVGLTDNRPVGNAFTVEGGVTSLQRVGSRRLAVTLADGRTRVLELVPPFHAALPPPDHLRSNGDDCLVRDQGPGALDDEPLLRTRMAWLGKTQVEVHPSGRDGPSSRSHSFAAEPVAACLSASGQWVVVTDRTFGTEIWSADFRRRIGPRIEERRLFGEEETPDKADRPVMSAKGNVVVTQSSFWDPPNLGHTWITAWDVQTGLPVADRIHLVHEGGGGPQPDHGTFDASDCFLALAYKGEGGETAVRALSMRPPRATLSWLPDLAEALGGYRVEADGTLVPVTDREARLRALLPLVVGYGGGPEGR